jgi:hypothetical protein
MRWEVFVLVTGVSITINDFHSRLGQRAFVLYDLMHMDAIRPNGASVLILSIPFERNLGQEHLDSDFE